MANVVSFHESIALPGDSGGAVAILTEPGSEITGQQRPSVTLLNAGVIHRVGPHRLHVRLARALAASRWESISLPEARRNPPATMLRTSKPNQPKYWVWRSTTSV